MEENGTVECFMERQIHGHPVVHFDKAVWLEINQGNAIEAITFYTGFTLRPLLETLRINYYPLRFFYNTRYAHYDLPEEVISRLAPLYYPKDLNDLRKKRSAAASWFWKGSI